MWWAGGGGRSFSENKASASNLRMFTLRRSLDIYLNYRYGFWRKPFKELGRDQAEVIEDCKGILHMEGNGSG